VALIPSGLLGQYRSRAGWWTALDAARYARRVHTFRDRLTELSLQSLRTGTEIGGRALYGDGMAAPAPRGTDPAARQLALDFRTRRRGRADAITARLLTADDLAERWQVPKSHVYRLTRDAKIPTVKLGRYYRYRLDAIEAFELGATVPATDRNGRGATADITPA
jgi:excisionase family DNA binding protein